MMDHIPSGELEQFVRACHLVAQYELVKCSSGNLSCRMGDELVLLSASRSWLADLSVDQVAVCNLADGKCWNDCVPTVESVFHIGILRQRRDVNVVLHFQSPFATAIACGNPAKYDFNVIPEVPYYIGRPGIVEYLPPGSPELADATIQVMTNTTLAILRNHGLVTVGVDYRDAIQRAVFFELACRVILTQPRLVPLSPGHIESLQRAGGQI